MSQKRISLTKTRKAIRFFCPMIRLYVSKEAPSQFPRATMAAIVCNCSERLI